MSTLDVAPPPAASMSSAASSREHSQPPAAGSDVPPSTSEDVRVSPAPGAVVTHDLPQSQPMTASASNSSQTATVENGDDSSIVYGTRSRNRTGGARPNYADDKELDLEIEASGRIAKGAPKKPAAANANNAGATQANESFATVNTAPVPASDVVPQPAAAPSTPSVSASAPSKKRKQPGSNTTVATGPPTSAYTLDTRSRFSGPASYVDTNMMSFHKSGSKLNAKKQLVADDGTTLAADDHVYLVCEPPGEPYYLARIMEFLHAGNDSNAPIDAVRVNWYYRPKDIGRRVGDTRTVFASMHSDTCPLASLRGKCTIKHINDVANVDKYRTEKDSFHFEKLYDRYMHRYYEVIPTSKVVNVPPRVKSVLDERWKFVLIEVGRGRDLTTESKKCIRCDQFAANSDSVDCAVCKHTYHMRCVRPKLLKKPARGFAWACAACSRKQEMKLEARNTPALSESAQTMDDEPMEDEDEDVAQRERETRDSSAAPEPHKPPTAAQIAQANLWPWRYLGVHSRPEDALDYDDRIYPRASSRLGPRHQANVNVWHGRPVELVKPAEIKKKYQKHAGSKKDGKMTKDTVAAVEAEKESRLKRPKWVVDEPMGYIARGDDDPVEIRGKKEYTAQLTFKMPDPSKFTERGGDDAARPNNAEALIEEYLEKVKPLAAQYDVESVSVDFLTKAVEKLQENDYDIEKALTMMKGLSKRTDLKLPDLNREEVKRFEEGVQKYGSELHAVSRHVGSSVKESRIVRFYYMWKKSEKGRQIWGNYEGRRSKKESRRMEKDGTGKLVDDVADDADDSAYDNDKANSKKRGFECKFCATRSSRQWRRAPATAPGTLVPRDAASKNSKDKSTWLTLALCGRCAYLWRRYAIQYESIEEVAKKIAAAGGRASKRKVDEELLRTTFEAHYMSGDLIPLSVAAEVSKTNVELPSTLVQTEEPPKKKVKPDKETNTATPDPVPVEKKKPVEKIPEAPLEPEPPRVKIHPCAVCHVIEVPGHELLKCRDCRLHVHGACYGVADPPSKPWFCDMCRNDHNLQVSTIYECLLCPVVHTPQELMEPLKVSHKKKTDREREKERLEREMVQEASRRWRQEQEAAGRPVNPREALKRTAWNNWIHITCALWTKEIKFGNAKLLDDAEGVGFIPRERFEQTCKICRIPGEKPTVKCNSSTCNVAFHVGCAHQANYIMGFDVTLVKGSRRDSVNTMRLDQETGIVTPGIWCPAHAPNSYVHSMVELTEDGRTTALQKFADTYKQADSTITGTVRRAAQFSTNLQSVAPAVQPPQRQASTINGVSSTAFQPERTARHSLRSSPAASPSDSADEMALDSDGETRIKRNSRISEKKCCTCLVEASPKWWIIPPNPRDRSVTPPLNGLHAESGPARVNGVTQLESSHAGDHASSMLQPHDTAMANGFVKSEPSEVANLHTNPFSRDDCMYQCHKCHVQKKSPPSSPSQIRPRERSRPEPAPEPAYQPPPAFNAPPPAYPFSRPSFDSGPPHSHPAAPAVAAHHSPWQGGPAQWSAPVMRNGPPGSNGPPMYDSQPYRPENAYGFPPRPSSSFGAPAPPNAAPHHSPPPGPFGMPSHHGPAPSRGPSGMPGRAPSPSRSSYDYSQASALGIGTPSATRSYASDMPRRSSIESPMNGFSSASRPPAYPQHQPPPRPGSTHAQSLTQIAQLAEAAGGGPPPPPQQSMSHSRQQSDGGGYGTPRLGPQSSILPGYGTGKEYASPTMGRPMTPAGAGTGHVPGSVHDMNYHAAPDSRRDATEGAAGVGGGGISGSGSGGAGRGAPGASASPSLRNLLS